MVQTALWRDDDEGCVVAAVVAAAQLQVMKALLAASLHCDFLTAERVAIAKCDA